MTDPDPEMDRLLSGMRQGNVPDWQSFVARHQVRLLAMAKQALAGVPPQGVVAETIVRQLETSGLASHVAEHLATNEDLWAALGEFFRNAAKRGPAPSTDEDTLQRGPVPRPPAPPKGNDATGHFDPQATWKPVPPSAPTPPPTPSQPAANVHEALTLSDGEAPVPNRSDATAVWRSIHPGKAAGTPKGTVFGDYELLSTIAKGGMGVVYKARQRKLNRIVALKMILAGQFADELDVARFYAEAESAAKLRHPNIVGIHEVGEVGGQHFFSMDFIEGRSLSDQVRENPLAPGDAARYGKKVALAMEYAHQQGILHRDLKPSNVLVDRSGEPLITDFGLAKKVGDQSHLTMSGTILGTPSYMPPEQAAGKGESAGPESDVYSLGAILYELVTGAPPFRAANPYDTIRQVLEREPVSPRVLNPAVPADLETICLKCLQKEPSRRYATAQLLADELDRFLEGRPILARPVGVWERSVRWSRRNPVVASLAAAALLFFALALAATTIGYIQTSRALLASEESFREAKKAVDDLFTRVSEDTLLNAPGMQPLRQDLLSKALEYYQRFLEQRGDDPTLPDELAGTLFRVGLITEKIETPQAAIAQYEKARDMQIQLLELTPENALRLESLGNTFTALGRAHQRLRNDELAEASYREAISVRKRLTAAWPDNVEYQRQLASGNMNFGLFALGTGNLERARREMDAAQEIRRVALQLDPGNIRLRRDLGIGYFNLGTALEGEDVGKNLSNAIAAFEPLLRDDSRNLDNQYRLVLSYRVLADRLCRQGEERIEKDPPAAHKLFERAGGLYQQAVGVAQPLAVRNPDADEYQVALAGVYMNQGLFEQYNREQPQAAEQAYRSALVILAPLVSDNPSVPQYRGDWAATNRALGEVLLAAGKISEAKEYLEKAKESLRSLIAEFPGEGNFESDLKLTEERLAELKK